MANDRKDPDKAPAASALPAASSCDERRRGKRSKTAGVLSAGKEHTFELGPFEVLVFDATPL